MQYSVKIARNFPFLSCKDPKFLVDESKSLYLTIPPRYRYPHLHSRVHQINDVVLFEAVKFMTVFMKSETVGSRRGLIQFSSSRIRRLFWEYCFMGRAEALHDVLIDEIRNYNENGESFLRSDWKEGESEENLLSNTHTSFDASRHSTKPGNYMESFMNTKINEYTIYESDIEFFRRLYEKNGWAPSYTTPPNRVFWEGYPVKVSTGSIVSFPKNTFNLKISNIPEDCQEWMIDEWFFDSIKSKNTSQMQSLYENLGPKIRRRTIHLEEGGQSKRTASLFVHLNVKQIQEFEKELEKVAEILSQSPILERNVNVEVVSKTKGE